MAKFIATALFCLGLACLARAQEDTVIGSGIYGTSKRGGGSTYTGPGNVISGAFAWWGLRAYNAAYASSNGKIINAVQTGNSHTCDILAASNGALGNTANCSSGGDNGQSASSFCGSTCTVDTLYDQSGNGNNITAANQPSLNLNCVSSLPCFAATSNQGFEGSITGIGTTVSTTSVFNAGSGSGTSIDAVNGLTGSDNVCQINPRPGTNQVGLYDGGSEIKQSFTSTAWGAAVAVCNGPSSVLNINGTEITGNPGSNAFSSAVNAAIGADGVGDTGGIEVTEAGIYAGTLSSVQRTALCHNESQYWGVAGSTC